MTPRRGPRVRPQSPAQPGRPSLGVLLLAVAGAVVVAWFIALTRQADVPQGELWPHVLRLLGQRVGIVAAALLWSAGACGFGCELRFLMPAGASLGLRWLYRAALGLGASAVLVLALGALGAGWAVVGVWALGVAALGRCLWLERDEIRRALREPLTFDGWEWMWVGLSVAGLVVALLALFLPPLDYDVLEYHLGVPGRYLEAGRIVGLPTNVYSNFPLATEMHYLVGVGALGKVAGGCFAKVMNVVFSVLAGLGVAALGKEVFRSRRAGLLALAAFATTNWLLVLACVKPYVEPALTAFTVLALLALVRWLATARVQVGWLALAGVVAGLACGTKYPAAVFLVLPVFVFLCAQALSRADRARGIRDAALFLVVALLAFSPWLIKNVLVTGNPVFPLLQGLLGGGGWGAADVARWAQAHPMGIMQPARLLSDLGGLLLVQGELPPLALSPAAFVFVPLLLFVRRRRVLVGVLVGYVALCVLLWLLFTHRIQRFLVPSLAVLVALSAGGVEALRARRLRTLMRAVALLLLVISLGVVLDSKRPAVHRLWAVDLARPEPLLRELLGMYPASEFARELAAGERMLSVGEARSFYFGAMVHTETVFDPKLLDELIAEYPEPRKLGGQLLERGFRYVFVNWMELARLQTTYAYEFQGRRHAGYSERIDSGLFEALEAAGVISPVRAYGPPLYTLESPEGWWYAPTVEALLEGAPELASAQIVFHPASYVVYRVEGSPGDE